MYKLGIGLLSLSVALGLFFVFTVSNQKKLENTAKETVRVYKEYGEMWYTMPGQSETMLEASVDIVSGTQVRTRSGAGYILFADNSMLSIDENTTLVVESVPEKISIFQTLGNTYHRVRTLESGREYEVRTPGTLAAVRGTNFAVLVDGVRNTSQVKVTKSRVAVSRTDTPQETTSSVLVDAGNQIEVQEDAPATTTPLAVQPLSPTDVRDGGWMERNELIDRVTEDPQRRRAFIEMITSGGGQSGETPQQRLERLRDAVEQFRQEQGIPDQATESPVVRVAQTQTQEAAPVAMRAEPTLMQVSEGTDDDASVPEETTLSLVDEDLPPIDPALQEGNDPFILEFDRRYEYWFPVYSDKSVLCQRASSMTPEILKARILAFETRYQGVVPNKEPIYAFLRSVKAYCASPNTDNRVLDEEYTTAYPF